MTNPILKTTLTLVFCLLAVVALFPSPATAAHWPSCIDCFWGKLVLLPNPQDPNTKIVKNDFFFRSGDKLVWEAPAGDITDGTSIPPLFQPIVGGPFEDDYLWAAIIHDHYTNKDHLVRTWQSTDKTFYEAMVAHSVPLLKAQVMYYAVYVFGPHWGKPQTGTICGENCIRAIGPHSEMIAPGLVFRPADYSLAHRAELKAVEAAATAAALRGSPLTLRDLEGLALARHSRDPFLRAAAIDQQTTRSVSSLRPGPRPAP